MVSQGKHKVVPCGSMHSTEGAGKCVGLLGSAYQELKRYKYSVEHLIIRRISAQKGVCVSLEGFSMYMHHVCDGAIHT